MSGYRAMDPMRPSSIPIRSPSLNSHTRGLEVHLRRLDDNDFLHVRIVAKVTLGVDPVKGARVAWNALRRFDGLASYLPNLAVSEVLPLPPHLASKAGTVHRIRQVAFKQMMYMVLHGEALLDVVELNGRRAKNGGSVGGGDDRPPSTSGGSSGSSALGGDRDRDRDGGPELQFRMVQGDVHLLQGKWMIEEGRSASTTTTTTTTKGSGVGIGAGLSWGDDLEETEIGYDGDYEYPHASSSSMRETYSWTAAATTPRATVDIEPPWKSRATATATATAATNTKSKSKSKSYRRDLTSPAATPTNTVTQATPSSSPPSSPSTFSASSQPFPSSSSSTSSSSQTNVGPTPTVVRLAMEVMMRRSVRSLVFEPFLEELVFEDLGANLAVFKRAIETEVAAMEKS